MFGWLHRHRWKREKVINLEVGMVFYTRHCRCGLSQILRAGPLGEKDWVDLATMKWQWDWEREWFEAAS